MSASQQQPSDDPAVIAQRPLPTQAFMQPSVIEWLLICFAQDSQLFSEARELIAEHHFKQNETPLRVLYEALCVSTDRYGGATYETLCAIVVDMLAQNQGLMLTDVQRQIIFRPDEHGLIFQICNPTGVEMEATNRNFSRDLLRRFAYERTVVEPLRRVMNPGFNQGVPENLTDFLSLVTRQQARLATLNSIPEADLTPVIGSQLVSSNVFTQTGVSFIDTTLGGQRIGDANGIIGPTGGGKTTLAVHMAVASAKQAWVDAQITNTEPELVIFITAEEAAIKLRPRIWSAFFQIRREKLDTMTSWDDLSQPGKLEPYELAMQSEQTYKLSEIERYQAYGPQLNACLRVLDLSGSDEYPNAGFGFIDEITSYLARYTQKIRAVYIDYAGIFCERYMQAKGLDEKNYRYLLKTFGDRCRQEISARFGCTTWILHQLKGAVGTSKATKLMHHSEAGESADFANNLTVCLCLGTVDPFTGCRRLNPSKVRYLPGDKITPPTLRINDDFAIMEDVTRLFIPSDTGQFLTPQDSHAIRATEGLEQRVPTGGPRGMRDTAVPLDNSQRSDI